MPNVTVQFQDWDGTPLTETYEIKYGASVEPPKSPSRVGYDFQGWKGNYTNIIEDTIITAKYDKKSFNITFCDKDGTVVSVQKVEWDDAAEAPDMSEYTPVDYVFSGWNVDPKESDWEDYTKVEGKMKLYATYAWENENLPVAIGMQDITLEAGNQQIAKSVQVNSTADGTIANVYVIGIDENENTAGAYSKMASANVEREIFYSEWSDWSTTEVSPSDAVQVETKKQYRYNNLLTAWSTTSSIMSGYDLVSTTASVGAWSVWQDTLIESSISDRLYREVETQWISTSTSYVYGHYCTGNVAGARYQTCSSNNTTDSIFNANCSYHSLGEFDSNDPRFQYYDGDYLYYPNGTKYSCSNSCWRWYRMKTYTYYKTQWRYRDTTYLYKFQKTSDWSEWSDTIPTSYNAMEERTLYRYRTVSDVNTPVEVDKGETYTVKGIIKDTDSDLSGKTATVLVYKRTNTDPTQSQIEYVDQITIGENNSYEITVIPKEILSDITGDFIVALAVKGATRLVNIDTIYAPKPEYVVTFIADGQVVSEQKVAGNANAKIPNAPEIAGKEFVKWDTSASNIAEDMVIYAVYEEKQYTVVYLDELNGTVEIQKADYNAPVAAEIKETPTGYEFKGWDAETVTLLCNTPDSTIYYTLNGEEPVVSEKMEENTYVYTEPIAVTGNMTIKACSIAEGKDISDVFELEVKPEVLSVPNEIAGMEEEIKQPENSLDDEQGTSAGKQNESDDKAETVNALIVGTQVKDSAGKANYIITNASSKNPTVEYLGPTNKKVTTVKIPETVTVNGIKCKVTSIGKNAFFKNTKLKKITLSKNIVTIKKKAFYNCKKPRKNIKRQRS